MWKAEKESKKLKNWRHNEQTKGLGIEAPRAVKHSDVATGYAK